MVVYLARHVVYLNRIVVTGMGNIGMSNIGMSNIGMSNIGMSNIGMSTGAYGNVKSPDFPLHHAPPLPGSFSEMGCCRIFSDI